MNSNYQDCLNRLLKDEGGYSNLAADPGGPTNFGITITDYRKYIKSTGTALDVKNMSVEDAKRIYKPKYWDAVGGDNLPSGVDYAVFDYGVSSGVSRALKIYNKYKDLNEPTKVINAICDERMAFLHGLHSWSTFGKGWTIRVAGVRRHSLELAQNKPVIDPQHASITTAAVAAGAAGTAVAMNNPTHWPYIVAAVAIALVFGLIGLGWYNRKNTNV